MKSSRQIALLWGGVSLGCVALAPLATRLSEGLAACPIKSWTGLPCPSCGATRVVLALVAMDPFSAWAFNPLMTLALVGFVVGGVIAAAGALLDVPLPALPRRLPVGVRAAVVVLVVANWAYLVANGI